MCLRLARFKKENKELLTFLLFEAHDTEGYTEAVKADMDDAFRSMNTHNVYLAKKTLRKVLRLANKHIRYIGDKQSEVVLLLHFCKTLKNSGLAVHSHKAVSNLYQRQVKKIQATLATLHPDIQYDLQKEMAGLVD